MDVDHWKTGRNILDLRGQKVRIEQMIPTETITTPEAAIQVEAMAGAKTKTDLCIACFTTETEIIGQGIVPSS
jgi:hypothetical protein